MSRPTMLVVHDDPRFTEQVREELTSLGFEVEVAIDPADAVSHVLARVPDVVFVNLALPRDSGYEVCELLRGDQSLESLPIVIMSDRHSPEDIAYAEEAGANVFLRLPSPSKSLRSLAAHLGALLQGRPPPSGPTVLPLRAASVPPMAPLRAANG